MNALRLASTAALAPLRTQSRTMVARTAPVLGGADPFEHPHGTWDHLNGATENHFSKKMAGFVVGSCVFIGAGLVCSAASHQNKKHGFSGGI